METVWFCLLGWMLATYVVLDGFDFGAGMLHLVVARNDPERRQVIRSLGPVWDGNEVWLLAAAGTMLFAFPRLLSVAFSGFYLPLMIVLWLLIFRALGIELRHQLKDPLWAQCWDFALCASSFLLALFFGAALGNVVRGVPMLPDGTFFEPLWTDFRVGNQTGILDWYTVLTGLTAVAALAQHGALWLASRTDGPVEQRSSRLCRRLWPVVVIASLLTTAATLFVQPQVLRNLRAHPWIVLFILLAIAGLAGVYWLQRRSQPRQAFCASAIYLYGMLALAAAGIYPYVLPAREPALGLTVDAAAAAPTGLWSALFWWIPGMLLACGYFAYLYRSLPERFLLSDAADH